MVANNQTEELNQLTKETVLRSTHVFGIDSDDGNSVFSTKGITLGTVKKKSITSVTTTPYTQIENDDVILVDATGAPATVNLLAADNGKQIIIKKTDASGNSVTIDGNGAQTIDGALTNVLTSQYDSVTLVSDGTAWHIVA
jgi:hypothetical protein